MWNWSWAQMECVSRQRRRIDSVTWCAYLRCHKPSEGAALGTSNPVAEHGRRRAMDMRGSWQSI